MRRSAKAAAIPAWNTGCRCSTIGLDTLLDYLPGTPVAVEPLAEDAVHERFAQIADYYDARRQDLAHGEKGSGVAYKPLPPDRLYFTEAEWRARLDAGKLIRVLPFAAPEGTTSVIDAGTRPGRNFAPERALPDTNVFDAVKGHVDALQSAGKRVMFALWSDGARDRMSHLLADHRLLNLVNVDSWPQALARPSIEIALAVLGIESGFETDAIAVIGEQDILGDRLVRPRRASKRAENFIAETTALTAGDLVVHVDHGIGRFVGLKSIEAAGAPHDCLEIHYAGNDKLYLPVENIELLSRYGSEDMAVELDRLGGAGWQSRKARMKNRIREMAGELIKIAAERQLREAPRLTAGEGLYDEFCAGFPYDETEDQQTAIDAVLDDLASGHPMDRLVCGDVGFGKTEVALRAAFVTALSGKQVAVVVPTTLLARQHFKTFSTRFRGLAGQRGAGLAPGRQRGTQESPRAARGRDARHRRRHPRAARQDHQVPRSRARDRGRGAAFRRRPQGAPEGAARRGACAHPDRDPDPAHPATRARRASGSSRSSPRPRSIAWRCAPRCRRSIP